MVARSDKMVDCCALVAKIQWFACSMFQLEVYWDDSKDILGTYYQYRYSLQHLVTTSITMCIVRRSVHRTFFTSDNVHVASFSDDKSVILWDIVTEQQVVQFKEHSVCDPCNYDFYGQIFQIRITIKFLIGFRITSELDQFLQQTRMSCCRVDTTVS